MTEVSHKRIQKKIIPPFLALEKAKAFCAYQERCHFDLRNRLREWELEEEVCENIMAQLISEGFINEERFARSFVRGKFRIKKWGRQKIRAELKKRNISDYCIRKGLEEINDADYIDTLKDSVLKLTPLKNLAKREVFYKTVQALMRKGFEQDIILQTLSEIQKSL